MGCGASKAATKLSGELNPSRVVPSSGSDPKADEAKDDTQPSEAELQRRVSLLSKAQFFAALGEAQVRAAADALKVAHFDPGQRIITQGGSEKNCFVIDEGDCAVTISVEGSGEKEVFQYKGSGFFGERALLRDEPRAATVKAITKVKTYTLLRDDFVALIRERDLRQSLVRELQIFETMNDRQVVLIASMFKRQFYAAGQDIITQGCVGEELYVLLEGECDAIITVGKEEKAVKHYDQRGMLFGELALLNSVPRKATVRVTGARAVTVFALSRSEFDEQLGDFSKLKAAQYITDPRKIVADFYSRGDTRGPAGYLQQRDLQPNDASPTEWFAVYRPCSRDAFAKMLASDGLGKALHIKGKSSKTSRLAGYIPFVQISDNDDKKRINAVSRSAQCRIFFQSAAHCEKVKGILELSRVDMNLNGTVTKIEKNTTCALPGGAVVDSAVYGLDVPLSALLEVYIMRADVSPMVGWETGRPSMPAFMNSNLQCVSDCVDHVLYQFDSYDPLNPLGLIIAMASDTSVTPLVSDMDTFLVASKGMPYETVPEEQVAIMEWSLKIAKHILSTPGSTPWNVRWQDILLEEKKRCPFLSQEIPEYGFGDPTSSELIGGVIQATAACGAVRHGAESFNYLVPQEMDLDFLVVWSGGFEDPPWRTLTEPELRNFLVERVADGFVFPVNAVWPVICPGWYDVLLALQQSDAFEIATRAWFPERVLAQIASMHKEFPEGFALTASEPLDSPQGYRGMDVDLALSDKPHASHTHA